MKSIPLGLCIFLGAATAARAEAPFRFDATPGKLAKTVIPLSYDLALVPDLAARRFVGHESIDIAVRAPVASVTLNATGLDIGRVILDDHDHAEAAVTLNAAAQTATLRFANPLAAGRHRLVLDYAGPIVAQPAGFYYDDYDSGAGAQNRRSARGSRSESSAHGRMRMLVTQFEVSDARRLLPCWDEPAFKASFALRVTIPEALTAISNMPAMSSVPAGKGFKTVSFGATPRMSSYLLDLDVGDLRAVHARAGKTALAVWTIPGKQLAGDYALQAEARILPYYNSYFGVPYPLPKLDMIAVPGNYAAGAMENWGAITFIDNALLFDPENSDPLTREEVFLTVAHEMAHQWSGDLVTMAWWNNLWLNEGFATWMEDKATDHFNPGWHIWERSHADTERAMAIDALRATHPVQQTIADESEADSAFDEISYEKGEAFVRMLEGWLGEDVFRAGMRRYMKAHAYSSSTSADLWTALASASGKDVAGVAKGFTEQPGIPLIVATASCVHGESRVTLRQLRFAIHDPNAAALSWRVPVRIGFAGGNQESRVVVSQDQPAQLALHGCDAPIIANLGATGYYRVQYDTGLLARLTRNFATLPGADRAEILADQWGLFAAGRGDLEAYLPLLQRIGDTDDLAVWDEAIAKLVLIDNLLRGSAVRAPFRAWARHLLAPAASRLGWDSRPGETVLDTLLRADMLSALGRFDDAATIAEAQRRFDAFLVQPGALPPALRSSVVGIVGNHADPRRFAALRRLGQQSAGSEEKLRYYFALGSARSPALVVQTVAIADSGEVANGRVPLFLIRAAEQNDHPDQVWNEVRALQARIRARLTSGEADGLLPSIAAATADPAIGRALLADPSSTATTGARRQAQKAVEEIATASDLRERLLPRLREWLLALRHSAG